MLVSVVIPTLNEAWSIVRTLDAVREGYSDQQVELIVADGGSQDGTLDLLPAGVVGLRSPRGRARQMNAGARVARGQVLVFCHGDTLLPHGWREAILDALSDSRVSGGAFQVKLEPAAGILHWTNRLRLPPVWQITMGDQVQFMRREVFDQIGGFPDIPLMEDIEMSRSLHRQGRLVRLPLRVTTSSRRFVERGPWRQWWLSARCLVRYLWFGATPQEIAAVYRSSREEAVS